MVNIRKPDVVATFRDRFKKSKNEKLQKLSQQDISDLLIEFGEGLSDILAAAPVHGFDGINLGAGQIKVTVRAPQRIRDIQTGEITTSLPTTLYYFKPSIKHKERMREIMKNYDDYK